VIGQVRRLLTTPEIVVRTWRAARDQDGAVGEGEVRAALHDLDPVWDELFPAEQARIVQLLVERVDVAEDGIGIRLRTEGLRSVVEDLRAGTPGDRRHEYLSAHHHRRRAERDGAGATHLP
jgi:hypothetical protein